MATKTKRNFLAEITRKAKPKPTACVAYGPPGIGKTSLGAAFPGCVFLIDDQEDGISTLKASQLVAEDIPVLPPADSWTHVMDVVDNLQYGEHNYKTLVIDTIGGMERLLHAHVCETEFKGDWGERGFASYAKGYEVSLPKWREFLVSLDRLRTERNMAIVMLAHSLVKPFRNPQGEDYDRFVLDMHHKTWGTTHKWADMVLFLNYFTIVQKEKGGKAKGKGGQSRIMHTEYQAVFDAKNRHNLPAEIDMGSSGQEAYSNLVDAIKAARKTNEGN
jgi:hypothetical protein